MKKENNTYEQQANEFLKNTGTSFKAAFFKHGKHFHNDKDTRDIYTIELKRGDRVFKFKFGQSINASAKYNYNGDIDNDFKNLKKRYSYLTKAQCVINKDFSEPTPYDVLTSLQKYDVGSFKDFCGEFGYSDDSINATKIYKAVLNEYDNVKMLWSDSEIEQLQEVQ